MKKDNKKAMMKKDRKRNYSKRCRLTFTQQLLCKINILYSR